MRVSISAPLKHCDSFGYLLYSQNSLLALTIKLILKPFKQEMLNKNNIMASYSYEAFPYNLLAPSKQSRQSRSLNTEKPIFKCSTSVLSLSPYGSLGSQNFPTYPQIYMDIYNFRIDRIYQLRHKYIVK
jgi:hypothetical protein